MEKYVWCEDKGSGFQFWKELFSEIDSQIIVESKGNNTRLRQAVEKIADAENVYYILIDCAMDNADVVREYHRLKKSIKDKDNIFVIDILSFEYALLSFRYLEDWVFASQDSLKEKRQDLLEARRLFIKTQEKDCDVETLVKLRELLKQASLLNNEQLSAKLLFGITRNTGFETTKSHLGPCFVNNCCEWEVRQSDDICGLDLDNKSKAVKMENIIEYSVLKQALQRVKIL